MKTNGLRSCLIGLCLLSQPAHAQDQPKLVLQITIDALRGDFLQRFDYLFDKDGGFRYLQKHGVNYINALYQHANTETIVGHTSLATGALPSTHGMIANAWFDRHEGRMVYNIEDADYKLLTTGGGVDKNTELDHTQKTAKNDGRSPQRILSSTLSDEIMLASNGKAKVFGVSIKDRGAVSMAGHAGKAFWFSKATGEFVTSDYYYSAYPEWVSRFNEAKHPQAYANTDWSLSRSPESYRFINDDDQDFETALPGFGRTFPHPFGPADNKYFTTFLTLSPAGDELTLKFVRKLLVEENIGADEITDYLAISFSSNDYVGHVFSASSLENEDNLIRLDQTLGELFRFIDEKVGLDNTLIVLSSDHGQPEAPGFMQKHGVGNVAYFDIDAAKNSDVFKNLQKELKTDNNLIETYFHPYLYLNEKAVKETGKSLQDIESSVARALMQLAGVKVAIPSHLLASGKIIDNAISSTIINNYHPARSGNIYVVFEPNVFINDFDGLTVASSHGSPWLYDRHIPLVVAGKSLTPTSISREVTPYALAPTISRKLGIRAPTGAVDELLHEVLE